MKRPFAVQTLVLHVDSCIISPETLLGLGLDWQSVVNEEREEKHQMRSENREQRLEGVGV